MQVSAFSWLRRAATTVLVGALGLAVATPAKAAPADEWLALADQAANEAATAFPFVRDAGQNIWAWWVSPLAWYAGNTWGWQDARTQAWLREIYARRTPSGGYGIGEAWDWRGDGSVNSPSTAYTITTAWHVGRTLIAGYDGGGVPRERVLEAVVSLLNTPQVANNRCISYSNNANDRNTPCVWNINATAAWFLWRAQQRGIVPVDRADEMTTKLRTWRDFTRANYNRSLRAWPYEAGATSRQDAWHNAATVGPMWELDPTLTEPLPDHFAVYGTSAANADLVIYDCSRVNASLLSASRAHAFPPYSTQRDRLATRSRWSFMALRVHQTCFA